VKEPLSVSPDKTKGMLARGRAMQQTRNGKNNSLTAGENDSISDKKIEIVL
jgi:hypothetical protein